MYGGASATYPPRRDESPKAQLRRAAAAPTTTTSGGYFGSRRRSASPPPPPPPNAEPAHPSSPPPRAVEQSRASPPQPSSRSPTSSGEHSPTRRIDWVPSAGVRWVSPRRDHDDDHDDEGDDGDDEHAAHRTEQGATFMEAWLNSPAKQASKAWLNPPAHRQPTLATTTSNGGHHVVSLRPSRVDGSPPSSPHRRRATAPSPVTVAKRRPVLTSGAKGHNAATSATHQSPPITLPAATAASSPSHRARSGDEPVPPPPPPPKRTAVDYIVGSLLRDGGWHLLLDDVTGRPYYGNPQLATSTWDLAAHVRTARAAEAALAGLDCLDGDETSPRHGSARRSGQRNPAPLSSRGSPSFVSLGGGAATSPPHPPQDGSGSPPARGGGGGSFRFAKASSSIATMLPPSAAAAAAGGGADLSPMTTIQLWAPAPRQRDSQAQEAPRAPSVPLHSSPPPRRGGGALAATSMDRIAQLAVPRRSVTPQPTATAVRPLSLSRDRAIPSAHRPTAAATPPRRRDPSAELPAPAAADDVMRSRAFTALAGVPVVSWAHTRTARDEELEARRAKVLQQREESRMRRDAAKLFVIEQARALRRGVSLPEKPSLSSRATAALKASSSAPEQQEAFPLGPALDTVVVLSPVTPAPNGVHTAANDDKERAPPSDVVEVARSQAQDDDSNREIAARCQEHDALDDRDAQGAAYDVIDL